MVRGDGASIARLRREPGQEERTRMNRMRVTCVCAIGAVALTAMFAAGAPAEPGFLPKTTKNNVTSSAGCKSRGFPCESGATEGTIETNVLKGVLNGITSVLPGV